MVLGKKEKKKKSVFSCEGHIIFMLSKVFEEHLQVIFVTFFHNQVTINFSHLIEIMCSQTGCVSSSWAVPESLNLLSITTAALAEAQDASK